MTHLSDLKIKKSNPCSNCNCAKWHSPNCRLYRINQADDFGVGNEIRHLNGSTGVVVSASGYVVVARYYDRSTGELGDKVNTPVWDLTNNFSME